MSSPRSLLAIGLFSVGIATVFVDGCASPKRGGDPGTAGTTGTAGSGPGGSGPGPGVAGTTGGGGETILLGQAGMTGAAGTTGAAGISGVAGTTGAAGSTGAAGTTGVAGTTGAAGGPVKMACAAAADPLPYTAGYTPDATQKATAMSTATAMSDTERAQQMTGLPQSGMANYNVFNQESNTTRNIRGFYFRDGPRGVNLNANNDGKSDYSTAFPVAMARGAAFDDKLENDIGKAIGDEMVASGNTMMLAPTINILRHPAWGRAQETYGEDVFLLGRLGSAFTDGCQQYAAVSAKHYAANNIENGRETATATIDEQTLREIYARHFEMVIQEGGAASVMAAYNQVNSTHSTQSSHLLNDILRTDFGFKGFVLSDWWAMPNGNTVPLPGASTLQPTALQAVKAGLDMELPWRYNYSTLPSLVSANQLTASDLITATARILEQKYRFNADKSSGFYKKAPFSTYDGNASIANNNVSNPAIGKSHIDLAQQAAEEGMVLLKNTNAVLPLKRTSGMKIAVLGANVSYTVQSTNSQDSCGARNTQGQISCMLDFTTNVRTGDLGSSRVFSDPAKSTGPYAGIMAAAGSGITVSKSNAASGAAGVDAVIVIAGMTPEDEGEEYTGAGDRVSATAASGSLPSSHNANLKLDPKRNSGVQDGLITSAVTMAAGKPVIVVLEGGGIIDMGAWYDKVQAVVMAWYPGQAGGKALGRLLFGDVAFSGKLPVTWSANLAHWPTFAESSGNTTMGYYLGYRYFDKNGTQLSPTMGSFPFGYGLSYTTFTYKNMTIPCATATKDANVEVNVEVYNDSAVVADETVFVFVQFPGSAVANRQPAGYKELKAYYRVRAIPANGGKGIKIPLRVKDLKYWDTASSSWKWETGKQVKVIVAPSADPTVINTPCSSTVTHGCSLSDTFTLN